MTASMDIANFELSHVHWINNLGDRKPSYLVFIYSLERGTFVKPQTQKAVKTRGGFNEKIIYYI